MIRIETAFDSWSAEFINNETTRLMAALSKLDVDNGIGILASTSKESVVLVLACIRLGLRTAICPLREPPEIISTWLSSLGIDTVVSASFKIDLGNCVSIFYVTDLLHEKNACDVDYSLNFSSLLRTSGTTATPKTACISARAHKASARAVGKYFSYDASSSWALSLPLYHVSGLSIIFRAICADASLFLACSQEEIFAGLLKKRISHISLVPTQLSRALEQGAVFSDVHAIILGGDAVPPTLKNLDLPIYETYGLTETASMIWAHNARKKKGDLLSHAALKILSNGEILVGGESLFDGYIAENNTVVSQLVDGFFYTGDLGFLQNGELIIEGRTHHRIISGGENIQAEEIERLIEQHPAVSSCVVLGIHDPDFGMRPCAIVQWQDTPLNHTALCTYLKRHVAPYKIPKTIITWPSQAPISLKKPRLWLSHWLKTSVVLDKSVIVGA